MHKDKDNIEDTGQKLAVFMDKLKDIINERLDHPELSIDQICLEMKVSRAQLHRKIKEATGHSTSLFIRQMRLEQARLLLLTTNLNISQIAYQVGISSPQNFSKYFVEAYGTSPSTYRKEQPTTEETPAPTVSLEPELTNAETPVPVPVAVPAPLQRRWLRMQIVSGLSVIISIFILLGLYFKKDHLASIPNPTLAVLSFKNKANSSVESLSAGIQEDILLRLKQLESLHLLPATDSISPADYKLEGECEIKRNKLSLTVWVTRVADQRRIWKKRYDSQRTDLTRIPGEIARQVVQNLQIPLSDQLVGRLQHQPTTSAKAYQSLLQGRFLLKNRTQESLQESLRWFDQAIQVDSVYSDAYLGKASALSLLVILKYSTNEKRDLRAAEQQALIAIKHNTNNARAYAELGNIYHKQYRWQETLTTYQIALKLDPHDALINYWYSLVLRSMGNIAQALHYNKIAYELDPRAPAISTGYIYNAMYAKRFGLADTLIQQAAPEFKQSFLYPNAIGLLLTAKGEFKRALPYFDTCQMLNPKYHPPEVSRSFCLGKLGKRKQIANFIATLDTTQARNCLAAAAAYSGLGEIELAVNYLQAAAAKGEISEYLLVDVRYAPLHAHPGFRKILEAYGLLVQKE